MRLLAVLPVAALTLGIAPHPRQAEPRPIVILVHGRGQLGQDTAVLRREWKSNLDSTLQAAGLKALRDEDVRLAWYADILDVDADSSCAQPSASEDSLSFGDVARGFLGLLASGESEHESREMRGLIGELLYVVDPARRCAAERRVGGVIDAAASQRRPVIVVAYSLGSMIAYGALRARSSTKGEDIRLLTIGSPLGIRPIRGVVFGELGDSLRAPVVRAWENVYDRDDFFAGPLEGIVTLPRIHDGATRRADAEDPHNFDRYLRDPATGSAILRLLCGAPRLVAASACSAT